MHARKFLPSDIGTSQTVLDREGNLLNPVSIDDSGQLVICTAVEARGSGEVFYTYEIGDLLVIERGELE